MQMKNTDSPAPPSLKKKRCKIQACFLFSCWQDHSVRCECAFFLLMNYLCSSIEWSFLCYIFYNFLCKIYFTMILSLCPCPGNFMIVIAVFCSTFVPYKTTTTFLLYIFISFFFSTQSSHSFNMGFFLKYFFNLFLLFCRGYLFNLAYIWL